MTQKTQKIVIPKKVKEKVSRARKTSSVPTRIYSYRTIAPITHQDLVDRQLLLASQFRNKLIEIHNQLWDRFRQIWIDDLRVGPSLLHYEDACGGVDEAYNDLRAAKSGVADPDLSAERERLEATQALRHGAYEEMRAAKDLAKKLDLEAERADKVVGPARLAYEEADKGDTKLRKQLRDAWRGARREAEEAGRLPVDAFRLANEAAAKDRVAARREYSARGLRHGAYARVEKGMEQAAATTNGPLSFERYDGTGSLGTQLTETGSETRAAVDPNADGIGMTLPELFSGLDTRLRLGAPGEADQRPRAEVAGKKWHEVGALPRNVRRHAARTYVDLRVGSDGRAPIFARFPVTLHRLPPKDAVIKWAYVVKRRVGHHYEWRFQLTLESKMFGKPPIAIGTGACAVNLGWRRLTDDQGEITGLRAAYVVDELGNEREVCMPDYMRRARPDRALRISAIAAIGKCDGLGSTRDETLERAQLALSQWISGRGGVPESWTTTEAARPDGSIPKTLADKLRGYSAWRAAWKLRRFIDQWKVRRVPGDEAIFAELGAWAKQDRHLESWQAHQREGVIARRREEWRVIATDLARQYATIVVGESKLTDLDGWERKAPEDGDPSEGREQRRMARLCAPGELRAEIKKAVAKTGAQVIFREEKKATQECYYCGHDEPWDAAPHVDHTCAGCGRTWDQDANYCRNLLKRSGFEPSTEERQVDTSGKDTSDKVQPTEGRPLAPSKPAGSRGSAGSDAAMQMSPVRS